MAKAQATPSPIPELAPVTSVLWPARGRCPIIARGSSREPSGSPGQPLEEEGPEPRRQFLGHGNLRGLPREVTGLPVGAEVGHARGAVRQVTFQAGERRRPQG